jgi:four helix bundle protein
MRDHTKLMAFHLADELAVQVYRETAAFPTEERFGLARQLRRSAVSVVSNIVEGCGRHTEADFLHFLDMAHGSARELEYQLSLAFRLSYLPEPSGLPRSAIEVSKTLNALVRSLRGGSRGARPRTPDSGL